MIYVPVQANDSIQQGDIYYNLPFIRFDMENINFLNNEQEIVQGSWINEKERDDMGAGKCQRFLPVWFRKIAIV